MIRPQAEYTSDVSLTVLCGHRVGRLVVGVEWASCGTTIASARLLSPEALTLNVEKAVVNSIGVHDKGESISSREEEGGNCE